jgi:hypothetical protein
VDWTLAKPRTERIVATLTVMTAIYFWHISGLSGLMEQLVNVAVVASPIVAAWWLREESGWLADEAFRVGGIGGVPHRAQRT